jgi:RimJ/RimL family protein N-acetyltransferase
MEVLRTADLILEPLTVAHAQAMYSVLSEPELYRFLDYGPPPSVEHVRGVYKQLERRSSPDGSQAWLNWVVCLGSRETIGFVQATVLPTNAAWVAYMLGISHWGRGHARAATGAVLTHLSERYGSMEFLATVENANARSISLLERLSFRRASAEEAASHELSSTEALFKRSSPPPTNALQPFSREDVPRQAG